MIRDTECLYQDVHWQVHLCYVGEESHLHIYHIGCELLRSEKSEVEAELNYNYEAGKLMPITGRCITCHVPVPERLILNTHMSFKLKEFNFNERSFPHND